MQRQSLRFKNLGSKLWVGCGVAVYAFLIPWILTAAMIWLFPGFSYGLVERWVCPVDSSIQVQGTAGWLFAVLSDDDSVDFPQFTCVNSQGAVVLRGDQAANWLAYMRVTGVVLLGFLPIEIVAFVLISLNARRSAIREVAISYADEVAVYRLQYAIGALETQRANILVGRPHSSVLRVHSALRILAPIAVFVFGCLFAALTIAEGVHPFMLGGLVLALVLLVADMILGRRIGPAVKAWDAEHRDQLNAIAAQIADK